MGTFGAVDVQYQVRHSEWYPMEMQGSVTVPDGERQARLILEGSTLFSRAFDTKGLSYLS